MNELKPCPFCGGNAVIKTNYSEKNSMYYSEVSCTKCYARSKTAKTEQRPEEGQLFGIIMRWNSRAPECNSNED